MTPNDNDKFNVGRFLESDVILQNSVRESMGKVAKAFHEVSEKDPHGLDPHAPGAKLDEGKPMAGILMEFGLALLEVAKVCTHGAQKYSRGGWQHAEDGVNRYTDAMVRHCLKEYMEDRDKDSGLLHASQVAWNALARLELMLRDKADRNNIE